MKKLYVLLLIASCSTNVVLNAQRYGINTIAGNGTAGYSGDGGPATLAEMSAPTGVVVDAKGNIYISDYNEYVIRKINTSGIISTYAGIGHWGYSGDGGPATSAELYRNYGIALDTSGNLYIADGVNSAIRKVNTGDTISTIAGIGSGGYSGDGGQATAAELGQPDGVGFDALGNLYIADYGNSDIRKISTNGIISTIAGNQFQGYSGDGGAATLAELFAPLGVAADASGNVFICDASNKRVRMVNSAGIIATAVGNGYNSFSGDGGTAMLAEISFPIGVVFDPAGNMYISDGGNNRIRKVNTNGIISTLGGNGFGGFSGDGGLATAAEMYNNNGGLGLDESGNVYVADFYNSRVRILTSLLTGTNQVPVDEGQLSVYPNPNSGKFFIQVSVVISQWSVEVYNVSGERVYSQSNIQNSTSNINLSSQPSGVYLYRVTSISGNLMGEGKLVIE